MNITYYAPDARMGDTSPENCEAYRAWALEALERAYPEYTVRVSAQPSHRQVSTDDDAHRERRGRLYRGPGRTARPG